MTIDQTARRLRDARDFLGVSQEHIASEIGIGRSALSDIERGQRKVSAKELAQFSKLYGVSVDELLGDAAPIEDDSTLVALNRTAQHLEPGDREEVLRFAQFLNSRTKER